MNEYETKTLHLSCLGPLHIGSGGEGKLNKTQYVFDREELRLYFINESAWVAFLQQKRLLQLFEKYVTVQAARPALGIFDWLKQQGVADRTAEVMATILRADGLPTGPRK